MALISYTHDNHASFKEGKHKNEEVLPNIEVVLPRPKTYKPEPFLKSSSYVNGECF